MSDSESSTSTTSDASPTVAACVERSKRPTAGTRMSSLVGKAAEEDEAFWSQSFFEEDQEDNASYRSSDESEENQIDTFDSDFDESEGEEEAQRVEEERGKVMENEIAQDKRKADKSAKSKAFTEGGVSLARQLLQKKKKREKQQEQQQQTSVMTNSARSSTAFQSSDMNVRKSERSKVSKFQVSEVMHVTSSSSAHTASNIKKSKRRFTQEELLLEALHHTEPENKKWLLGRKRDMAQTQEEKAIKSLGDVRVIQKFNSRRGCYNTLTFPEMDHVPALFDSSKRHQVLRLRSDPNNAQICVITGMKARYRDPKTMLGYHDIDAFKELRRRLESGELKLHLTEPKVKSKNMSKNNSSSTTMTKNGTQKSSNEVGGGALLMAETISDGSHQIEKESSEEAITTKSKKISKGKNAIKKTKVKENAIPIPVPILSSSSIKKRKADAPEIDSSDAFMKEIQEDSLDLSRSGRKRKKSEKMQSLSRPVKKMGLDPSATPSISVQESTVKDGPISKESHIVMNVTNNEIIVDARVIHMDESQTSNEYLPNGTSSSSHHTNEEQSCAVNQPSSDVSPLPCFNEASLDLASMFAMSLASENGFEITNQDQTVVHRNESNSI